MVEGISNDQVAQGYWINHLNPDIVMMVIIIGAIAFGIWMYFEWKKSKKKEDKFDMNRLEHHCSGDGLR